MREASRAKATQLEEGGRKDNLDRRQPSFGTVRGVAIRSDCLDALDRALAHSLNDDHSQTVWLGDAVCISHRDRQRALAMRAITLRNVDAPERERAIASLSQCPNSACFLLRGIPNPTIYPRGLPAVVVRHPLHGKGFTAERVGQEMLQGTDLAPSSRLHCLHNTRLEPPHRPVDGIPVNGVPSHRASGERTSQCCHRCHLPSLFQKLAKFSCDERPDGRLPACAWGHVAPALNPYPPHDRVAFASSILLYPHAFRLALRLAFPCGRHTGFPCSVSVTTNGVGALCPPVALLPMTRNGKVLVPAPVPFWPKPASTFGLFSVTMLIKRSPGFALPSILAPSPSWC